MKYFRGNGEQEEGTADPQAGLYRPSGSSFLEPDRVRLGSSIPEPSRISAKVGVSSKYSPLCDLNTTERIKDTLWDDFARVLSLGGMTLIP